MFDLGASEAARRRCARGFLVTAGVLAVSAALVACGQQAAPPPPPPAAAPVEAPPVEAAPAAPAGADGLELAAGWSSYMDKNATATLTDVPGQSGTALEMAYDLKTGVWLGAFKQMSEDATGKTGFRFVYRTEGAVNTIEFKLEDADGTNSGRLFRPASSWTTVEIPFSQIEFWWTNKETGGNNALNLADFKVHFAVSKKDPADQGGAGKLFIDQLVLY